MALDTNGVKFLLYAFKSGVSFECTLTLGRQTLNLERRELVEIFARFDRHLSEARAEQIVPEWGCYADELFLELGATIVHSMDASAYEGATLIHDLNLPIDSNVSGQYSAVIDGGTLEHVFNYPTALSNAMEMPRKGGHLLAITPVNNFLGHGFYQFSPELFTSALVDDNGFHLKDLLFVEDKKGAPWYSVANPEKAGRRVTLINAWPAYLLVIAERTDVRDIFSKYPSQADYKRAWEGFSNIPAEYQKRSLLQTIRRVPIGILRRLHHIGSSKLVGASVNDDFTPFNPF